MQLKPFKTPRQTLTGGGVERYLKSETYCAALQKARTEKATLESLIQASPSPNPNPSQRQSQSQSPSEHTRGRILAAARAALPRLRASPPLAPDASTPRAAVVVGGAP